MGYSGKLITNHFYIWGTSKSVDSIRIPGNYTSELKNYLDKALWVPFPKLLSSSLSRDDQHPEFDHFSLYVKS